MPRVRRVRAETVSSLSFNWLNACIVLTSCTLTQHEASPVKCVKGVCIGKAGKGGERAKQGKVAAKQILCVVLVFWYIP